MEESTLREFEFDILEKFSPNELLSMNRPLNSKDFDLKDELEKYDLTTVAYKLRGMGHYSAIGKRMAAGNDHQKPIYYFLHLGGSSGYDSIGNHIVAQHYCHHDEYGQHLEELVDFLQEDAKKKNRFDQCWGFPLYKKGRPFDYELIRKFFENSENKDKCFLCHV
jgi:hypothetical protein